MVERLLCKQEVDGSIPFVSTMCSMVAGPAPAALLGHSPHRPLRGSRRPSLAPLVPDTLTHGSMPQPREMAWVRFPDGTRRKVELVDKADARHDLDEFVPAEREDSSAEVD